MTYITPAAVVGTLSFAQGLTPATLVSDVLY